MSKKTHKPRQHRSSKLDNLLSREEEEFLSGARIAHLATADAKGRPSVVPVVFILEGGEIYVPIDGKPKKNPRNLRRLRNIQENPNIAFLVDYYDEDWSKLAFIHIRGKARILNTQGATSAEIDLLGRCTRGFRKKYVQYGNVSLGEPEMVMIQITPESFSPWGVT